MLSAFHGAADFSVGVSGDITIVVGPGDGEMLIDDSNERSLSYGSEIEKSKQALQQETMLTVQGLVNEEMYIWCHTVDELFKGAEKGCFVIWDGRSIDGIELAKYTRRNILQRVARNL